MLFRRQDLDSTDYQWNDDETRMFNGEPSRRIFNRTNGNQVLFLINFIGSLSSRFSVEEGKQLEQTLQFDLPLETRSEIAVFYWMMGNSRLFK